MPNKTIRPIRCKQLVRAKGNKKMFVGLSGPYALSGKFLDLLLTHICRHKNDINEL